MENKPVKKGWRLNLFDIIIIAVVIVAAAVLLYVWRYSGSSKPTSAGATSTVRYTIELKSMIGDTASKIHVGDQLMDSKKKYAMGTVLSVSVAPTTTSAKNLETGDTVMSEVPGKQTATIELETSCTQSDSQILAASGYLIRVGSEVQATGPGYAGLGYIVAIDRGGNGE